MNKKLLKQTFITTTLAAIYVFGVSQILQNGEKLFGENTYLMPFTFLLLFSLSAAVMIGLILGRSVFLFLDNKRKDSVIAAIYSIGWLGVYSVISLILLMLSK